jgi:hypothetical protein
MSGPGPWFIAAFTSDCSWGDEIEEGDQIRADGDGGWEHLDCCEDPEEDDWPTVDEMFGE